MPGDYNLPLLDAVSVAAPEVARSLLVLGQIERRRKARQRSRAALRRACELAAEMGHCPLLAQIEREMPLVAAARAGNELTAAEQRVVGLIAAGATNRDAAAALFVSVRTVETRRVDLPRARRPDPRRTGPRAQRCWLAGDKSSRRAWPASQRPARWYDQPLSSCSVKYEL